MLRTGIMVVKDDAVADEEKKLFYWNGLGASGVSDIQIEKLCLYTLGLGDIGDKT